MLLRVVVALEVPSLSQGLHKLLSHLTSGWCWGWIKSRHCVEFHTCHTAGDCPNQMCCHLVWNSAWRSMTWHSGGHISTLPGLSTRGIKSEYSPGCLTLTLEFSYIDPSSNVLICSGSQFMSGSSYRDTDNHSSSQSHLRAFSSLKLKRTEEPRPHWVCTDDLVAVRQNFSINMPPSWWWHGGVYIYINQIKTLW